MEKAKYFLETANRKIKVDNYYIILDGVVFAFDKVNEGDQIILVNLLEAIGTLLNEDSAP